MGWCPRDRRDMPQDLPRGPDRAQPSGVSALSVRSRKPGCSRGHLGRPALLPGLAEGGPWHVPCSVTRLLALPTAVPLPLRSGLAP